MMNFAFLTRRARKLPVAVFLLTASLAQASAAELTKFRYSLLTQPGIWDAGVVAGIDRKMFADEGLDIELISPTSPPDGLKLLVSGGAELATAHSTDAIIARSKGLPIVSIATNHQRGTSGVMAPAEAGVKTLKDLEGKTVGITGIPFNKVMLEYSLKSAGADLSKVKIVTVGFTQMPLLLSKRIDALGDAISWAEPATYNIQVGKPAGDAASHVFFPFADNGVPRFYTLGLVADEAALARNPELYRRFLRAWSKALDWTIKNQSAALDGLIVRYPAINRAEAAADLAEIAKISVSPETEAHGLGWQDISVWEAQDKFMLKSGQTSATVDVGKAMSNAYLPAKP